MDQVRHRAHLLMMFCVKCEWYVCYAVIQFPDEVVKRFNSDLRKMPG